MSESFTVLRRHFFRRFFDNDTLETEGDMTTMVSRAMAFVSAPALMVAFFLQPKYGQLVERPYWAQVSDHYFFVVDALVTMVLVAVFEWEMLFPDRMDFLVLSPLPVGQRTMLAAKAAALGQMLGMFLVSTAIFGTLLMPTVRVPNFWLHLVAHAVATMLAGSFGALAVLAVGGLMVCVLGPGVFRRGTPVVQSGLVLAAMLMLFWFPLFGHFMQRIVETWAWARWLPPVWFLGVYERVLGGDAAWMHAAVREAMESLGVLAGVSVVTYPLAWVRKQRMAIENTAEQGVRRMGPLAALLYWVGARRSEERLVFGFIGQTMARSQRYQVYLAMYAGAGLALVTSCVMVFRIQSGALRVGLSQNGLHAVMTMLLFWLVAGLRTAFMFPVNLPAAWVFAMSGANMERCVEAARKWVLLCGLVTVGLIAAGLWVEGMPGWALAVQVVCGVSLAVMLADGFFAFRRGVPFTRPRMSGKSSLPILLAMYLGVLPAVAASLTNFTIKVERTGTELWVLPALAAAMHLMCRQWRRRNPYVDAEDEMDGTMTLGLVEQ